jgi:hypothetical protein
LLNKSQEKTGKTLVFSENFLIKYVLLFAENSSDMTINQIAQAVFNSFANTDIVVAILNHNGSYVSNKLDVFEQVFAERNLLDELCSRVDDGQEPLISQIDGFIVAASCLSSGLENVGYSVMLLPACSFGNTPESVDFIEIMLEQFSLIAGLIEQNQQLKDFSESGQIVFELPVFANLN